MKIENIKKKLNDLGLEEKEIDIYLAVLALVKSTVTDISRKTAVKRTTIYEYIDSLLKKGLIYKTIDKKRIYYCANNPQKISGFLEEEEKKIKEKKTSLDAIIPELESLYSASFNKPGISFYEGRGGIKNVYKQILNAHKNVYSIFS